jgi:elongation factor P
MKISGNEVRAGQVIELNGRVWLVVKHNLVQPGKGGAFNQIEIRDIKTGTKSSERFRSAETVERLHVDEKEYQYLYADGDSLTFMDQETFDQITLPRDMVGDQADFLKENMVVTINSISGSPVAVHMPQSTTATVVEADAVVKGQTASSSYKPAKLDNGVRVMVPPFVGVGTKIVVNIAERTYVERAKD